MIRHLAMNVTQNLNLFPEKGGALAHYRPHMILSQRNCDYNKHCQVEFGSYIQTSQVNNQKNNNIPRTLDGIYLCPTPTFKGRHQITNQQMGKLITRK